MFVNFVSEMVNLTSMADFGEACQGIGLDESGKCIVEQNDMGLCSHCQTVLADIPWRTNGYAEQLFSAFNFMFGNVFECPALASWVGDIVVEFGKLIDERALQHNYTADLLKDDSPLRGRKRLLAVDEDLRHAIVQGVKNGRAARPCQLVCAMGIMDRDTGRLAEWKNLNDFMAACWIAATCGGDVSIIPDATRIGNPGQETLTIPA